MDRELGTVLVSGGASGLGAAVVTRVLDAGGHPVVLDRQPAGLGPDGRPVDHEIVDLTDSKGTGNAVHRAAQRYGRLDATITCAGIDMPGPITEVPAADWERVVAVNLLGTAAVVRAAVPYLERSQGRIVTVASTLGHRAVSDATAYCASKFGIVGFTRALTAELRGRVGVTLFTPGGMDTRFFDARDESYKPPPGTRLSDPQDVAAAVVFALRQPLDAEIKEMVVAPATEGSWP